MTVYVDRLRKHKRRNGLTETCHCFASTESELKEFARLMAFPSKWIQQSRSGIPHLDLSASWRTKALWHNASEDWREGLRKIRRKRKAQGVGSESHILSMLAPYMWRRGYFPFSKVSIYPPHSRPRIIDMLTVGRSHSQMLNMLALEVKTSRSDFFKEVRDTAKRRPFVEAGALFYFVTPAKLVKPSELPEDAGLIEMNVSTGGFRRKKGVPHKCIDMDINTLPIWLVRALCARAGWGGLYTPQDEQKETEND